MTNLVLQNQTYQIIGACMEVHRQLGGGFAEIIYKDALAVEFRERGIYFEREVPYCVHYKEILLPHHFYADLVVFDEVILEVKAVSKVNEAHVAQTLNYLKASKKPVGLLINFANRSLEHKRFVF